MNIIFAISKSAHFRQKMFLAAKNESCSDTTNLLQIIESLSYIQTENKPTLDDMVINYTTSHHEEDQSVDQ